MKKTKTYAQLFHKYRIDEIFENGEDHKYMYKTPYCICYFYGENARKMTEEFKKASQPPVEFFLKNGFKPTQSTDLWEIIDEE